MANKKVFTDESLATFVDEIKSYTDDAISNKATNTNEADLLWGGKDLANSVSPVDASFIMELSANRFSFISPECITVEYSQDGGSTWLDYGLTDTKKTSLFTDNLTNICYLGKQTKPANVANQLRITVTGGAYFMMRKLAIYISTGGNGGCQCKVEKAKYTTQDTWTTVKTVSLGGYPGWNIINLNARFGGANSITDMYKLRLTFSITTASGSVEMSVQKIYAYSDQAWDFPSNLSRINHLYDFDINQNATFPAMVNATDFKENGTLLSSKYALKSHTHEMNEITGLEDKWVEIDSDFATIVKGLDKKADLEHTHESSEITGLEEFMSYTTEGFAKKADLEHSHNEATTSVSGFMSSSDKEILTNRVKSGTGYNSLILANDYATEGGSTASAPCSVSIGCDSMATVPYSLVQGYGAKTDSGNYPAQSMGYYTIANQFQCVVGKYNEDVICPSSITDNGNGSIFVVGCGTSEDNRLNAFRTGTDGRNYGRLSFAGQGADYAEFFEYIDGNPNNEDRRGLMVAIEGDKIRLANKGDKIIGIISANPSFVGDIASEEWHDRWLRDIFGEFITEEVEISEYIDEKTGKTIPSHTEKRLIPNPEYDPTRKYISREYRKEWGMVGLIGKLTAIDDGTCEVGNYCTVGENGIATFSNEETKIYCMKRIDENHIKVFIRF